MKLLTLLLVVAVATASAQSTCTNGVIDGTETGIDCGGDCPACIAQEFNANGCQGCESCDVPPSESSANCNTACAAGSFLETNGSCQACPEGTCSLPGAEGSDACGKCPSADQEDEQLFKEEEADLAAREYEGAVDEYQGDAEDAVEEEAAAPKKITPIFDLDDEEPESELLKEYTDKVEYYPVAEKVSEPIEATDFVPEYKKSGHTKSGCNPNCAAPDMTINGVIIVPPEQLEKNEKKQKRIHAAMAEAQKKSELQEKVEAESEEAAAKEEEAEEEEDETGKDGETKKDVATQLPNAAEEAAKSALADAKAATRAKMANVLAGLKKTGFVELKESARRSRHRNLQRVLRP